MIGKIILTKILPQTQLIIFLSLLGSFPARADDINSYFIKAAAKGDTVTIKNLIAKGAKIDAKDNEHWTALMWAAKGGHTDTVQAILAGGGNVNIRNMGGFTALMYAAINQHTDIVKILQNKTAEDKANSFGPLTNLMNETRTKKHTHSIELSQTEKVRLYAKAKKRREAIRAAAINRMRERFKHIY